MLKKIVSLFIFALMAGMLFCAPAGAQEKSDVAQSESPWKAMFPDGLIKAGEKSSAASDKHFKTLKKKFVGVYSSAIWCGPCRVFTPQLVKFYQKNKKEIEIVFRSSDNKESDMIKYAKKDKMKWLAVPFGKRCTVAPPSGIPHLVIYAPDGTQFAKISGSGEKSTKALEALPAQMKKWRKENKD